MLWSVCLAEIVPSVFLCSVCCADRVDTNCCTRFPFVEFTVLSFVELGLLFLFLSLLSFCSSDWHWSRFVRFVWFWVCPLQIVTQYSLLILLVEVSSALFFQWVCWAPFLLRFVCLLSWTQINVLALSLLSFSSTDCRSSPFVLLGLCYSDSFCVHFVELVSFCWAQVRFVKLSCCSRLSLSSSSSD